MILVVPMTLLKMSLNAFLIGLGIYFGKVYTSNLTPSYKTGNLAILIIFVLISTLGIVMRYVPEGFKKAEDDPLERYNLLRRIDDMKAVPDAGQARSGSQPQNPSCPRAQSSTTHTLQSVHTRNEDGRMRYTVPLTPPLDLQRSESLAQQPDPSALERTESVNIPPRTPSSPQVSHADTSTNNTAVRAALADMIRCQEEMLSASR
jgi:hypothetical protein